MPKAKPAAATEVETEDPLLRQEADELEQVIEVLDTLWDQGEPCVHPITGQEVPNPVYDGMRSRLAEIRPDSRVFEGTNASKLETTNRKVKHDPPMTSIHKANGSLAEKDEIRRKWLQGVWDELKYPGDSDDDFNVGLYIAESDKVDGVAVSIEYKKGKLHRAGLRPRNGIDGEDVTANVKYVEGVPEKLPTPIDVTVRGELYCPKSVFGKKNLEFAAAGEKTFANPRNYTTGSIRQFKDPTITASRGICFLAYSLLNFNNAHKHYDTEYGRYEFCTKVLGIPHVHVERHGYKNLKEREERAKNKDYEVDGVVLSVNRLDHQAQMGTHGDSPEADPKGKLAWKFEEEHADVIVKEIAWYTGRTRKITPVANFDGVQLAGTTVVNCTLHSLGFMRRKKVGLGTNIRVIKSGKIIPFVQDVVSGHSQDPEYPEKCPSCGSPTHVEDNGLAWTDKPYVAEVSCTNVRCGASAVSQLIHFLVTIGVKGLGESAVQALYDKNLVKTWGDFYRLDKAKLALAGFSERESVLALARLKLYDQPEQVKDDEKLWDWLRLNWSKKVPVPLWQLFASLGINGAGKSVGRALEAEYKTLEGIVGADVEGMQKIDGIGLITAETVADFFRDSKDDVLDLLNHFEPEGPKSGDLTSLVFCFSGGFEKGKQYYEKVVSDRGAKVVGSVSKKVTHFVAGPGSGSKSEKAQELGIAVLSVDDLKLMGVE
jgi:DNA ligase (NAD+)